MKSLHVWMAFLFLPAAAGAAGLCANVKAGVTITNVSYADGIMKASGTWQVGEDSVGAMVEYRLQSDRQWAESRSGTSGTWEVSLPWKQCDRSTLRVDVFPSLKVGDVLVHCTENGKSTTRNFVVSCAPTAELGPCQWECAEEPAPRCSGTCTGTAKGGAGLLMAMQGINGEGFQIVEGPAKGPWTWTVACAPGDKVSFRVRDQAGTGVFSKLAERPCGAE
jgi:hypothetical protein